MRRSAPGTSAAAQYGTAVRALNLRAWVIARLVSSVPLIPYASSPARRLSGRPSPSTYWTVRARLDTGGDSIEAESGSRITLGSRSVSLAAAGEPARALAIDIPSASG